METKCTNVLPVVASRWRWRVVMSSLLSSIRWLVVYNFSATVVYCFYNQKKKCVLIIENLEITKKYIQKIKLVIFSLSRVNSLLKNCISFWSSMCTVNSHQMLIWLVHFSWDIGNLLAITEHMWQQVGNEREKFAGLLVWLIPRVAYSASSSPRCRSL